MLTYRELREYRENRGLSLRDVAEYCDVTPQYIGMIERGEKDVTENAHVQIVQGINAAYAAKKNGTFKRENPANPKPVKQGVDKVDRPTRSKK